jgi:hypothetical protein
MAANIEATRKGYEAFQAHGDTAADVLATA